MSVLTQAIELRGRSDRAASNFLLTLMRDGRQSDYFRSVWAEYRAESLDYFATHEILRPLRDERFGKLAAVARERNDSRPLPW